MNKKRILIVDDEPSVTRTMKLNLEATGNYQVQTENHSSQALATARSFRPDLVLLDVMMPEPDGGEVAAQFQADPYLKSIPIVYLTALVTNKETGGHEKEIGDQPFLAKPADLAELTRCIEQHLRR